MNSYKSLTNSIYDTLKENEHKSFNDYVDLAKGHLKTGAIDDYDYVKGLSDGELDDLAVKYANEDFAEHVLADFQLYLDDNGYTNVDEDIINDYFTGLFYDIYSEEDLDDLNRAEEIIRHKYLGESTLVESSKKQSKNNDRVMMKQGNITCLKTGSKYKVFEDEDSNVSWYDSEEEAMRDTLKRCGINPDNELKEKGKLKESFDANSSNSMEAIRDYIKNNPNGGSILFNSFYNDGYEYDVRVYPQGFSNSGKVEAWLEPYLVDDDEHYTALDNVSILDGFSLDMTDEDVINLVNKELGTNFTNNKE